MESSNVFGGELKISQTQFKGKVETPKHLGPVLVLGPRLL